MKEKIEILIVEDSKTQAEELKYFLESNNYKVQHANNGEEALALLKQNVPDIIISDVAMPQIDGYELCKRVKSDENLKMIQVILLTSLSGPEEIFKSLECGADSFVTKPYSEDFLITKIKDIIYSIESREDQIPEPGFEIAFGDQKYLIDSTRLQIIDFHLSINENAVKKSRELDKTNKELALSQHKLNELNKNLEEDVKGQTQRIEHLNVVLRTISNVNQLLLKEKDRKILIQKACKNFIETREVHSAWIALFDDDGKIIDFAGEGDNIDISKPDEKFLRDYIPYCFKEALKTDDIVLIENVESDCKDCPWLKLHKEGKCGGMVLKLKYGEKNYGILNISLAARYITDKEEQILFKEIGKDIAFALYSIELEKRRKQAEEKYGVMFEMAKDAVFMSDETGKFVDVNQMACESLGYSKEELLKLSSKEIDADPRGYEAFLKIRNGAEEQTTFEVNQRRKDGTLLPVEITGSFFTSGGQRIALAIARDISERKRAEEALQFERSQLLSIFDSVNEIIYVVDPKTYEILYVNRSLKDAFKEDIVGGLCYKKFQGFEKPCEFCTNEIIMKEKGEPYQWEYHNPILKRDYMIIDRIIKWPDGRDVRFELAIDITERKLAEEALKKSEEQFRLITVNTSDLITLQTFDIKASYTYVSPSIKTIAGYEPEDLLGKSAFYFIHPDDKKVLFPLLKKYIGYKLKNLITGKESSFTETIEFRSKDKSGNWCHFQSTGNIIGNQILFVSRDITERKRAEKELKARLKELEVYYKITLGREGRIIELKHQVNELLEQLGKEKKYKV